jgi:hypothetical protein
VFLALISLFVIAFTVQINLPPLERYPGWDHFWVDTMSVGKLSALKYAVSNGELPALSPYVNFDENLAGDPSSPVSVVSPVNLLVLVLPIKTAIVLRTMVLLALGGCFSFVLLHRVTQDKAVSFMAALTYIGLPYTTGLHYHYAMAVTFFVLPMIVFLLLPLAVRPTRRRLVLFGLTSMSAVATGDVNTVFTLGIVVFITATAVAWHVGQLGVLRSLRRGVALTAAFMIASLFYLVPLAMNLRAVSSQMNVLQAGGWYSASGLSVWQVVDFVYRYGAETIFKPIEGSGLLLYVPFFVLFAVLVGVAFHRTLFVTREQRAVFWVLVTLGLVMLVACPGVYVFPGSVTRNARGVLRVPINMFPFMMTLAAFCCLAAVRRSPNLKTPVFALIAIASLALDLYLFSVPAPNKWEPVDSIGRLFAVAHMLSAPFRDSNLVDVRFMTDMWQVLPWANLALLVLALTGPTAETGATRTTAGWGVWIALALLVVLFGSSLHNTLRIQQEPWQWQTRDPYRYNAYLHRKACTDALVDRRDPNFRTLYVGAGRFGPDSGRDWQLIAETELHQVDRTKVLFSYRETMHPYAGVMRGVFSGTVMPANVMPPLSRQVPGNIWNLRLMGVRWVISVQAKIDSPDLAYVGECSTPKGPVSEPSEGTWYVYQVQNPTGVAFLADRYRKLGQIGALRALLTEKQEPLRTGTVFLEEDVSLKQAVEEPAKASGEAHIAREGFSYVEVAVNAPAEKCLVLSYVYRPRWSVTVDGRAATIHRAYGGLMGVMVPAGRHRVRWNYSPADVRAGLLFTVLGLGAVVAGIRIL